MNALKRAAPAGLLFTIFLVAFALTVGADEKGDVNEEPKVQATDDVTTLSLQDLMALEVTTVSRKPQSLSEVAAAAYVITSEDIRRSGASSIPEVLRLVPGMHVARIDSNKWAVSVRGFNGRFANKLLVLIDGRSVYTPLFSGVFWEVQDTLLEDIERIEVIRGPGASLWGANAVNGIINIITKSAERTHGGFAQAIVGTEESGNGAVRFGGRLTEDVDARGFVKYFRRDAGASVSANSAADNWDVARGGFRLDAGTGLSNRFSLQGDWYDGRVHQRLSVLDVQAPRTTSVDDQTNVSGLNFLGKLERQFSDGTSARLQVFVDRTKRNETIFSETRDTYDLDFQHQFKIGARHDFVWGLSSRISKDHLRDTSAIVIEPDKRSTLLAGGFAQDEFTLGQRVHVTFGSKFEHNDFTGFEFQPSVRLMFRPNAHQSLWGAVSRAVRTPSRSEHDVQLRSLLQSNSVFAFDSVIPAFIEVQGTPAFVSEELIAYEVGYRATDNHRLSLDLTAFYNDYDHLRSAIVAPPELEFSNGSPHLVIPLLLTNAVYGDSYGTELWAEYEFRRGSRVQASYSYVDFDLVAPSADGGLVAVDDTTSAKHQVVLRSLNTVRAFEIDATARYVDGLLRPAIPSYFTVDVRFGWQINDRIDLSIGGHNLLDSEHLEFISELGDAESTAVERSLFTRLRFRF